MSKIEIGRYSEQLRKMLGQAGTEIVAGELSPEISAVIVLEQDAAEWNFLKHVRDCGGIAAVTGVAVNVITMRLRNPATSGVIAQVSLVSLFPNLRTPVTMGMGEAVTDLALAVNTVTLDSRWGQSGVSDSALVFSTNNATTAIQQAGRAFYSGTPLVDTEWKYREQIVIPPGTFIDWGIELDGISIRTSVRWKERQLPALEQE